MLNGAGSYAGELSECDLMSSGAADDWCWAVAGAVSI